jgi:hypothetical protein
MVRRGVGLVWKRGNAVTLFPLTWRSSSTRPAHQGNPKEYPYDPREREREREREWERERESERERERKKGKGKERGRKRFILSSDYS